MRDVAKFRAHDAMGAMATHVLFLCNQIYLMMQRAQWQYYFYAILSNLLIIIIKIDKEILITEECITTSMSIPSKQ